MKSFVVFCIISVVAVTFVRADDEKGDLSSECMKEIPKGKPVSEQCRVFTDCCNHKCGQKGAKTACKLEDKATHAECTCNGATSLVAGFGLMVCAIAVIQYLKN